MTLNTPKVVPPICPKCGYDQSGIASSWTDRCPLEGRCAECGLDFVWSIVMDPSREQLYWYSEHGRTLKESVRRTPRTFLKMLVPHRFWREVTVLTEVRLKALGFWVMALLLVTHLVASVPVAIGAWIVGDRWLNSTFVRYIEIHGVQGAARIVFNGAFSELAYLEFQSGRLKLYPGTYYATGLSDAFLILLSYGSMVLLWFVVLMVVPTTRRMAKLRAAHVVRAAILSLLVTGLAYELFRFFVGVVTSFGVFDLWTAPVLMIFFLFIAAWMLLFWGTAVRIGWRVRPSWLLIVLGTIASALGGFVAMLMPMYFS